MGHAANLVMRYGPHGKFNYVPGDFVPPMTVYKSGTGSVYQSWCEGGPDGATYAATKTGWFDMDKFNQWIKQVPVTVEFLSYKKSLQYRTVGTGTV